MGLAKNQRLQKLVGGSFLERGWLASLSKIQIFLLGKHKEAPDVRLVRQVRRERNSLLTAYELYHVLSLAKALGKRDGAMAEVGVFQGSSAKLMCEAKRPETVLHLFDTFEGLPKAAEQDGDVHRESQYTCSLESVQEYLRDYPNVHLHKGLFPDSAAHVEDLAYSFVHLDVDLYESTKSGLEYFYPRMIPGGVILSHDYSLLAGVKQAFQEFAEDRDEAPIELCSTQCMLIKTPQ